METMESIVFDEHVQAVTSEGVNEKVRALLGQQFRRLYETRSCLDRLNIAERIRGIAECAHALGAMPTAEFTAIISELRRL